MRLNDSINGIKYLDEAMEMQVNSENWYGLVNNYITKGKFFYDNNKLKEARSYFEKSLEICNLYDQFTYNEQENHLLNNIASIMAEEGDYDSAASIYKTLYKKSIAKGDLSEIKLLSQNLSSTYKAMCQYDSALFYYETFKEFSDSLLFMNDSKEIEKISSVYENKHILKQIEIELLERDNKLLRERIVYSIIVIILILLALLFLLGYYRQKQKNLDLKVRNDNDNQILQKEIENKKKELTTNVMYLLKKNEFISTLSLKLNELSSNLKKENISIVQNIIREINNNTSSDSWKEFEVRFEEVYTGFYNKLIKEYPTLTPNELRLCAFLRLNMSTKEIAAITYQSNQSIKVARYRLRKKLNIDDKENLVSFITRF